tara:strand:+ start:749 stop:1594 length:846 start_codon:yes stop_codon:yes gene_type:complete
VKIKVWSCWFLALSISTALTAGKAAGDDGAIEKVVCALFELEAAVDGQGVDVSLDTDLPVNTSVMLSVSRDYSQADSTEMYSQSYFSQKTLAGSLRRQKSIPIDDEKWKAALHEKQEQLSRLGEGFDVVKISDLVEVSVVVHINQSDPRFGKGNSNLVGCGAEDGALRTIRGEAVLSMPFKGRVSSLPYINLNPRNLDVGKTYIVDKRTPLLPAHTPQDPLLALGKLPYQPPDGNFTVIKTQMVKNSLWYWVSAFSPQSGDMGRAWINSVALLGQKLQKRN